MVSFASGKSGLVALLLILVAVVSAPVVFDSISSSSFIPAENVSTSDTFSFSSVSGDINYYSTYFDGDGAYDGGSFVYVGNPNTTVNNVSITLPDEVYNNLGGSLTYQLNSTDNETANMTSVMVAVSMVFSDPNSSVSTPWDAMVWCDNYSAVPQTITITNGSQSGTDYSCSFDSMSVPLNSYDYIGFAVGFETDGSRDVVYAKDFSSYPTDLGYTELYLGAQAQISASSITIQDSTSTSVGAGDLSIAHSTFVPEQDSNVPSWVSTLFFVLGGLFFVVFLLRSVKD